MNPAMFTVACHKYTDDYKPTVGLIHIIATDEATAISKVKDLGVTGDNFTARPTDRETLTDLTLRAPTFDEIYGAED